VRKPGTLDRNDHCFRERASATGRLGGLPAHPVVDGAGRVWPSMAAAGRAYRLSHAGVRYRVENGLDGWRYAPPVAAVPLLVRAAGMARKDGRIDEAVWLLEHARRLGR